MRDDELHVIRTDVLLWALGGFAEPETTERHRRIALVKGYAAAPKHSWPHGTCKALASALGATSERGSFSVWVCMIRKGTAPPSWPDVPPATRNEVLAAAAGFGTYLGNEMTLNTRPAQIDAFR